MPKVIKKVASDPETLAYLAVALRELGRPLVFTKENTRGLRRCSIEFESAEFDDDDTPMTATLIDNN